MPGRTATAGAIGADNYFEKDALGRVDNNNRMCAMSPARDRGV